MNSADSKRGQEHEQHLADSRAPIAPEVVLDPATATLAELQERADKRCDLLGIARVDIASGDRRFGKLAERPW